MSDVVDISGRLELRREEARLEQSNLSMEAIRPTWELAKWYAKQYPHLPDVVRLSQMVTEYWDGLQDDRTALINRISYMEESS